jgi:cytidyltransferase-like protein
MEQRAKQGVIHGRFQGLHFGHIEYLLAGKERCDFLFIGITNPDPSLTQENSKDLKRSEMIANPFTYYERALMIRDAMIEHRVPRYEFEIIPFPINHPELIKYYAPLDALFFVTVYDEWGAHKLKTLQELGCKTDLMWTRTMAERFSTGKEVRALIANGERWEHLTPPSVAEYIKKNNLDKRLKKILIQNDN